MTLEELNESLPNGLHDARIVALTHAYENATINLEVEILTGLPVDPPTREVPIPQRRDSVSSGSFLFR